jgi:hypothetical protein
MKKWLWVLLGGIAFLWAAFWGLNFRIAASSAQSEKSITTTGIGEGLPDVMQRSEKINLVVIGEDPLIALLQESLVMAMKHAGIPGLQLVQSIEQKYPSPVLVIRVGSPDLLWTPFFATSQFTIQLGYSSSGYTAFIEEAPSTIDNKAGPALNMYGEFRIADRSWGLISRPGYYHFLADHLASQIVSTLKDLYRV